MSTTKSSLRPVVNSLPQGSMLVPVTLTVFTNDLLDGTGMNSTFSEDKKLGRVTDTSEGCAQFRGTSTALRGNLQIQQKKMQSLVLGRNNLML